MRKFRQIGILPLSFLFWILLVGHLSLTRIISTPFGIALILSFTLYFFFVCVAFLFRLVFLKKSANRIFICLSFLSVLSFSLSLVILFHFRIPLLGINLFYIPSQSMQPTLLRGDIVLVDTLYYQHRLPQIGEVVVFYQEQRKTSYVKRVKNVFEQQFIISGDNLQQSISTNEMGVLHYDNLKGKVTGILLNINDNQVEFRFLKKIQ